MADKILLPTSYKDVPLTDCLIDDFWYEQTAIWTTTGNTSTAGSSIMTLTTAATDNLMTSIHTAYGTCGQNSVWEMTVRFKCSTTTATTGYAIGWIGGTVDANSMTADGASPYIVAGAFLGIISPDVGSGTPRFILLSQGTSGDARQSKVLDWTNVIGSTQGFQTVKLRLEQGATTGSLYVWNETTTGKIYPETSSRNAMNNFAPVRGYQDPPQVSFAYLENILNTDAAMSVFMGVKPGTAAASTMVVDYVALAKNRAT